EQEEEEIRRRRAEEDCEGDEEEAEMVVATCMLNESRQHHRRRGPNVDRHRQPRGKNLLEDYFIPNSLYPKYDAVGVLGLLPEQKLTADLRMLAYGASAEQWKNYPTAWQGGYGNRKGQKSIILEAVASFDTWVWYAFFRVAGSQNDLNVLGQSPVFNNVLRGHSPQITYRINNTVYLGAYYLSDGIYPRWTTFVKTISNHQSEKEKSFAAFQEGYRKDAERCFGILQARWAIIRGVARMLDEEVLRSIMMTCIILHNMVVENEYDYDAPEVFKPDPMNTALTRIYERPVRPNGQPMEHEPLIRDGRYNNPMIDRYQEMQSSYVQERRQVDLIEHL
ncbi:unnamed protein product, partial [Prunus brigantina]